jgi:hypothetical protein
VLSTCHWLEGRVLARLQQPEASSGFPQNWVSPIVQVSLTDAAEALRTNQPRILTHFHRVQARIPDHPPTIRPTHQKTTP